MAEHNLTAVDVELLSHAVLTYVGDTESQATPACNDSSANDGDLSATEEVSWKRAKLDLLAEFVVSARLLFCFFPSFVDNTIDLLWQNLLSSKFGEKGLKGSIVMLLTFILIISVKTLNSLKHLVRTTVAGSHN